MSQIVDVRAALIGILKADAAVATEVGTRVFGDELPRSETSSMPRKCVVLRQSGGAVPIWGQGDLPLEIQRYDVICYGATLFEAEEVRRAVYGALKGIKRNVQSGVLVHWAKPAGGAATGREAKEAEWPFHWNSWQVCADERTAA